MSAIGDKADIGTYRQDIPSLLAEIRLSIDGLDNGRHRPVAFAKSLHQEGLAVAGTSTGTGWIDMSACSNGTQRHRPSMNLRTFALGTLLPTSAAVPAIRQSKSLSGSGRAVTCMPWTSI